MCQSPAQWLNEKGKALSKIRPPLCTQPLLLTPLWLCFRHPALPAIPRMCHTCSHLGIFVLTVSVNLEHPSPKYSRPFTEFLHSQMQKDIHRFCIHRFYQLHVQKKKKKNPESSKKQIWICFRPATFWPFTLVFTSEHLLIYWYSKVYGRMCIGYMQILHHFICYLSIHGFWYLRGSWNQFLRDNSVFMTCFWFSPSSLECFPP